MLDFDVIQYDALISNVPWIVCLDLLTNFKIILPQRVKQLRTIRGPSVFWYIPAALSTCYSLLWTAFCIFFPVLIFSMCKSPKRCRARLSFERKSETDNVCLIINRSKLSSVLLLCLLQIFIWQTLDWHLIQFSIIASYPLTSINIGKQ